jgi:hypothetical protein
LIGLDRIRIDRQHCRVFAARLLAGVPSLWRLAVALVVATGLAPSARSADGPAFAALDLSWKSRTSSVERVGECSTLDQFFGGDGTMTSAGTYYEVDRRIKRVTAGGTTSTIIDYDVVYSAGYTVEGARHTVLGPDDRPFELNPAPGLRWESGLRRSNLRRHSADIGYSWTRWPIATMRTSFQVQIRDGDVDKITGPSKPKAEFAYCRAEFSVPKPRMRPTGEFGPVQVHTARWISGAPWLDGVGTVTWDMSKVKP